jgi:SAM-dependent methyltransferase
VVLPFRLLREYQAARALRVGQERSDFDEAHGLNTDGEFNGWTYLSDLEIPSPNWIEGTDYTPIEPERFHLVITALPIAYQDFTFVDFGSGKGRALLLASEFAFKRIIGLEFSPELDQIARENIRRYPTVLQKCRDIQSCPGDFVEYSLPSEPLVLFFFNPCHVRVLSEVVRRIGQSLHANPRPLYLAYVAPWEEQLALLRSAGFLKEILCNVEMNFVIYQSFTAE